MKKLSETYKELGIAFSFPIKINDDKGNRTYYEDSTGYWIKQEYDVKDNETYYEDSEGFWSKCECDAEGNQTYYESGNGYWVEPVYWDKREYDAKGNRTYYENSYGVKRGTPRSKTCEGKVIEVDGKQYKLTEL